jgi:ribosome hibernation promoting factor
MNLTIHTENLRLTDDLEEFVQKKLSRLGRYLPNINSIHVEISQQNSSRGPDIIAAQITLRHSRGAILRTEEKSDKQDYNSVKIVITSASDKMYRRIRRFKGKRRSKRGDKYGMTAEELMMAEPLPELEEAFDGEYVGEDNYQDEFIEEPTIIRRKEVAVIAMNEEEAVEQMELLGHSFFLFFNPDSDSVNVVYKRGSGGYGILEPNIG